MKIDPKNMTNRERHVLTGNLYVPRPISLISTISEDGIVNLAPYSLSGLVCYHPVPYVFFTPIRRGGDGGVKKDSLVNVEQTGEWVVNMVSEDIAQQMQVAAAGFASEIDEFQVAGLTPVPSDLVGPPRVAESPISLECQLVQITSFGRPIAGEMVMGEVLMVHVKDDLYRDGDIDTASYHVIGRMGARGGNGIYTRTRDLFEMPSLTAEDMERALAQVSERV